MKKEFVRMMKKNYEKTIALCVAILLHADLNNPALLLSNEEVALKVVVHLNHLAGKGIKNWNKFLLGPTPNHLLDRVSPGKVMNWSHNETLWSLWAKSLGMKTNDKLTFASPGKGLWAPEHWRLPIASDGACCRLAEKLSDNLSQ